jgi:hypothetical protein
MEVKKMNDNYLHTYVYNGGGGGPGGGDDPPHTIKCINLVFLSDFGGGGGGGGGGPH